MHVDALSGKQSTQMLLGNLRASLVVKGEVNESLHPATPVSARYEGQLTELLVRVLILNVADHLGPLSRLGFVLVVGVTRLHEIKQVLQGFLSSVVSTSLNLGNKCLSLFLGHSNPVYQKLTTLIKTDNLTNRGFQYGQRKVALTAADAHDTARTILQTGGPCLTSQAT
jgi:hypothetical protein